MGKPLSADIRERVVAAYERGEGTQAALARRFDIGEATVRRLVRLKRETGSLQPRVAERYGRHRKPSRSWGSPVSVAA